ncbi:MAG: exodeoxyribonuclease I [Candidatus Saccharimonadales bacterium]
MTISFFFYDLETSGIGPRTSRIMQFAGQRTDMNLQPVGEPVNRLIKLSDDILPDPDAVLITGITPQQTIQDGETEAEFLKYFTDEIAVPGTIFVGYNTIRFDDEFMRFLHYRNFYDPYEWQWADSRSKWDLLDVVRMTRALRPEGIEWPFAPDGAPSNRLELLTKVNGLDHTKAHDALNDVYATIAVARLIRGKQPKLFDYLVNIRDKKAVAQVVESGDPFVYSSGRYASESHKTTVVATLGAHPTKSGSSLVYDLRYDPLEWANVSVAELADRIRYTRDQSAGQRSAARLPVKPLQYNHCPAIAPLGVVNEASQKHIGLDLATIKKNFATLKSLDGFMQKVQEAFALIDKERQTEFLGKQGQLDADEALYDGFIDNADKQLLQVVRAADTSEIAELSDKFHDGRLRELLPRYKARNYPASLTDEERQAWEAHRAKALFSGGNNSKLAKFFARLGELAQQPGLTQSQQYLLEELQLYGQSIMPSEFDQGEG